MEGGAWHQSANILTCLCWHWPPALKMLCSRTQPGTPEPDPALHMGQWCHTQGQLPADKGRGSSRAP